MEILSRIYELLSWLLVGRGRVVAVTAILAGLAYGLGREILSIGAQEGQPVHEGLVWVMALCVIIIPAALFLLLLSEGDNQDAKNDGD